MTMTAEIGEWFKKNRENYQWPKDSGRTSAEQEIQRILSNTQDALGADDPTRIRNALLAIHGWKSYRTLSRYEKELANHGDQYFTDIATMSLDSTTEGPEEILRHLKIPYSNLPVSSAIASFLYGRKDIPVIDIFVAQFFAKRLRSAQVDEGTRNVLSYVPTIQFKLQTYEAGSQRLRLAVYKPSPYEFNLRLYIDRFVPSCRSISDQLKEGGFRFRSPEDNEEEFEPIDVEMAIFTWGINNPKAY